MSRSLYVSFGPKLWLKCSSGQCSSTRRKSISRLSSAAIDLASAWTSGPVSDPEMAQILGTYPDIKTAASKMIEKANENGGPDNITCVLVRWVS